MDLAQTRRVRRARTFARLVGALVGMVSGVVYGSYVARQSGGLLHVQSSVGLAVVLGTGVAGAAALALAAPLLSVDPFLWMEQMLDEAPVGELIGAVTGLIVGLLIATLVAVLLSPLP
jgi:uncharacterized protein YacL